MFIEITVHGDGCPYFISISQDSIQNLDYISIPFWEIKNINGDNNKLFICLKSNKIIHLVFRSRKERENWIKNSFQCQLPQQQDKNNKNIEIILEKIKELQDSIKYLPGLGIEYLEAHKEFEDLNNKIL